MRLIIIVLMHIQTFHFGPPLFVSVLGVGRYVVYTRILQSILFYMHHDGAWLCVRALHAEATRAVVRYADCCAVMFRMNTLRMSMIALVAAAAAAQLQRLP